MSTDDTRAAQAGQNAVQKTQNSAASLRLREVRVYTDGSSHGNPGPGGYGAVLEFTDAQGVLHTKELSEGFKKTTNNRMEVLACIVALEALKTRCKVSLFSDSRYLINACTKGWLDSWQKKGWKTSGKKAVKNVDLWQRLLKAMEPHKMEFFWVKGHAGHPQNERCDALANAAAEQKDLHLLQDLGFERSL